MADIAEKGVWSEARTAAMAHISTCSACDDTLLRLRQLIRMMRNDRTEDAPHRVLTSAIRILSPRTPQPFRRVVAVLTFDSRSAPQVFGIRSLHATSRQMLFSAQDSDLDLRITVQHEECIVAGQVLRESCSGGLVEILGATGSLEASLNELCEFTLPAVPFGKYLLRAKMVDLELEVPELELKL